MFTQFPYLRFIRVHHRRAVLCCCTLLLLSLLVFVTDVLAQVDPPPEPVTATPVIDTPVPFPTITPTWAPLWPTRTPAPTDDLVCPSGTPIGWGTVTPDSWWALNCYLCLPGAAITTTATAFPTTIYQATMTAKVLLTTTATPTALAGTGTAVVSATPGATPTITPTPTKRYFYVRVGTLPIVNHPNIDSSIVRGYAPIALTVEDSFNTFAGLFWEYSLLGSCQGERADAPSPSLWGETGSQWDPLGEARKCATRLGQGGCTGLGFATDYTQNFTALNAAGPGDTFNFGIRVGNGRDSCTGTFYGGEVYAIYYGDQFPTPTPTVTPVPTQDTLTYCEVVKPEDSTGDDSLGGGFELPYISVGPISDTCPSVSAFTIPLAGLLDWLVDVEDIEFPGVRVCMRMIDFGFVKLFGISIDLDLMAFTIAALATIRMFMRS